MTVSKGSKPGVRRSKYARTRRACVDLTEKNSKPELWCLPCLLSFLYFKGNETPSKSKMKSPVELVKAQDKSETFSDCEQTFESFTAAEIQESQEFSSQPGTPLSESITFSPKMEGAPSRKISSASGLQSCDVQATWQDIEARRRKEQEQRMIRIQFENGERGELHPR